MYVEIPDAFIMFGNLAVHSQRKGFVINCSCGMVSAQESPFKILWGSVFIILDKLHSIGVKTSFQCL